MATARRAVRSRGRAARSRLRAASGRAGQATLTGLTAGALGVSLLGTGVLLAPTALADRSGPTGSAGPPTAADVERSRAREAGTEERIGRIEAQLAAGAARSDQLAADAGAAVEAYNGARLRLVEARAAVSRARARADEARAAVEVSRRELGRFAAAAYRTGGDLGGLSVVLVAATPRDLISRAGALQAVGTSRARAMDDFRAAEAFAHSLERRAEGLVVERRRTARAVAQARHQAQLRLSAHTRALAEIAARRESLVRQLAAARHTTVRLERARQVALEQARVEAARRAAEAQARARAAAEARRAEAARQAEQERQAQAARQAEQERQAEQARRAEESRQAELARQADEQRAAEERRRAEEQRAADERRRADEQRSAPAPAPAPVPAPQPAGGSSAGSSAGTSTGADAAVAYARAQIGKPYQWGADGPGSFDCSGLTMRAWQQGGVSLPHYSVAQYDQAAKVPVDALRPGDLVFFASNPADHRSIYHVALYVGSGQMIEAPYTGENVRVSSIWRSSLFGAARP